MAESTLVDLKKYLEAGKYGRQVKIGEEYKPLTTEDKKELLTWLDELGGVIFDA